MHTRRFPTHLLPIALTVLVAACGAQSVAPSDVVTPPLDAVRVDVPSDHAVVTPDATGCTRDAQCDNGLFCDGAERCVGGACVAGAAPCDDGVTCTQDTCNAATHACAHTPDDAPCSDGMACNGDEHCAPSAMGANPMTGCLPPGSGSLDCDDGNVCTIDTCSDMTGGCMHSPRDLDGDGFVDAMCGGPDCDDSNPGVHPGATENCSNGIDDDCNGFTDGADPACMVMVPGASCANPIVLPGPGTYSETTVGHGMPFAVACGPALAGPDEVFAITLAAPTDVTFAFSDATDSVRWTLQTASSCAPLIDTGCAEHEGTGMWPPYTATLPAGTSYIFIQTAAPEDFTLAVSFDSTMTHTTYVISQPSIPFVDVCAIPGHGTALATQDDTTVPLPTSADVAPATLPFALRMYDNDSMAPLSVSSNGWVSLLPTLAISYIPQLPGTTEPNLTIAGLWEDLFTRDPGVCYATVGTTPSRRFLVEWADATLFANRAAHITFEIAIDEAPPGVNNTIEMVYQHVSDSAMPSIGLENATGTAAVTYTGAVTDGLALRFTPVAM